MPQAIYHNHHYTPDETDHIREHYGKTPISTLAADLGRSPRGVSYKASNLGLRSNGRHVARTMDKLNAMARQQGCPNWGLYLHQIRRSRAGFAWPGCRTAGEVAVCQSLWPSVEATTKEVAKKTGLSASGARKICLGLFRDGILERQKRIDGRSVSQVYKLAERKGAYHTLKIEKVGSNPKP